MNERKLGRGLSALLGDGSKNKSTSPETVIEKIINDNDSVELIEVSKIVSGIYQPRKHFNHEELSDLSKSIKENGIIQPIIVRKADEARGIYEIIAGERRYRAAKMAGMHKVPVIIKHINNLQALEFAIVENVQRTDLSAVEEANGYKQLMAEFNYTQDEIAKKIGHSRSRIANSLRLLSLPKHVLDMIDKGVISAGHGRALIGRDNATEIADRIVNESLSVRDVEELMGDTISKKSANKSKPQTVSKREQKNQHLKTLETNLSKAIDNLKVKINFDNKKNKGKIIIFYNDPEMVEKLIKKLKK